VGNGWTGSNFYNSLLYWRWHLIYIDKKAPGADTGTKFDCLLSEVNLNLCGFSPACVAL
jgi:hypothetical protein